MDRSRLHGNPSGAPEGREPVGATGGVRRVFLECTRTRCDGLNTGIQRVVRNLVNQAPQVAPALGLTSHGVWFDPFRGFQPVRQLAAPSVQRNTHTRSGTVFRLARGLLDGFGCLETMRRVRQQLRQARQAALRPWRAWGGREVQWQSGDVLLLADQTFAWAFPWKDLERVRRQGGQVGLLIYDMIPVLYPQFFKTETLLSRDRWLQWWSRVREEIDFAVAISESVVADVRQIDAGLPPRRRGSELPLRSFVLGADLDGLDPAALPFSVVLPVEPLGPRFARIWASQK